MDNGFVKFYRKMTEWKWYTHETTFRVFIHLIFKAQWEDKYVDGILLKRGQVKTTWKEIASELKILDKRNQPARQPVRTALKNLKSTNDITTKKTNKGTIITINNYNKYQNLTNNLTNKKTKTNQQPNQQPNQPYNKENKEIKESIYIHKIPNVSDVYIYIYNNYFNKYKTDKDRFLAVNSFLEYYQKEGHKLSKDWKKVFDFWIDFENCMKEIKENGG